MVNDFFRGADVNSFGVSGNFIYGLLGDCSNCKDPWFLYDINTRLWAKYSSADQLKYTLRLFNAPMNEIRTCNDYFTDLTNGKRCYWYPTPGNKYHVDTVDYQTNIDTLVIANRSNGPKFLVNPSVNTNRTGVYFYNVHIEKGLPDSLYISVDNGDDANSYYSMATDGMVLPVFSPLSKYDLTLYMPFETAKRRQLSNNIFDSVVVRRSDSN